MKRLIPSNGIPTKDHFFARGDYDDMGEVAILYEDVVLQELDNMQLVWIYLDDDFAYLYENEAIQALTPKRVSFWQASPTMRSPTTVPN